MPEETAELFNTTLVEIAHGPRVGSRRALTLALMKRLAEKGLTIEQLSDKRMMNLAISTLKKYARDFEIAFPDFVPVSMRPDDWRKKKKDPAA